MKNIGKIVVRIVLILLCIIVIVAGYLLISPMLISEDNNKVSGSDSWMSKVDGSLLINQIAIPGTHDSASDKVQLAFFSKCQSSSIAEQLENGYRYLDVRLGVRKDALVFYHGFCRCRTSWLPFAKDLELSMVLADCYGFLSDHPTETIIFAVKMEQGNDLLSFEQLLDSYIKKAPDKWLLTDKLPTLDEARGKIVLFRRYADVAQLGKDSGIEIDWPDQGGNDDVSLNAIEVKQPAYTLIVQDRYKYSTKDKWAAFEAGLKLESQDENVLKLHFLSTNGTPKFGHPYGYAKVLNKNLLSEDLSNVGTPWIITDFSTSGMAKLIYDINFK